ncbi:MAG: hypothetical protein AAGG08_05570 [Actinomycetota bacterium]
MTSVARVEWLTIAGDVEAWRRIGLVGRDDPDGSFFIPLHGTGLRIVPSHDQGDVGSADDTDGDVDRDGGAGLVGWAVSGIDEPVDGLIDGLVTEVVPPADPVFAQHPLGASGLDHVVVLTADLSRTTGAIESSTGCELKRVREVGEMRQGFHRVGPGGLIVEVVARPEVPAGPASFWGLVLNVDDLDAACELLGELVGAAKDAVQPGRRIATLRSEAGLGLPVALMTT